MKKLFILIFISVSGFAHPGVGIVHNSKGEIFYSDLAKVWKISADGKTKRIVVPNVHTHELHIDSNDNLYGEHLWYEGEKTDKWGHFVWKLDSKGHFTKVIDNTEGFLSNYSFNRDGVGNMFWIERGKTESFLMKKGINGKISIVCTFKSVDVRWQYCNKNGVFYFVDDNDLFKIQNGKTTLVAQDLDGVKGIDPSRKPNHSIVGIWDDNHGNLYATIYEKREVVRINKNGKKDIVFKCSILWHPTGGVIDANGNLWVLENNDANQVRVSFVVKKDLDKE